MLQYFAFVKCGLIKHGWLVWKGQSFSFNKARTLTLTLTLNP